MPRNESQFFLPISRKEVVLREGDGYTEKAMMKKNRRLFETVSYYLAAMTVKLGDTDKPSRDDILSLSTPDIEYLSIEAYKLNIGDIFEFDFTCPHCGKPDQPMSFDLNALEFRSLPPEVDGVDPTLQITLPRSQQAAVVGMISGHSELILLTQQADGTFDNNQADFRCLRSLDGRTDFSYEDVINLPILDHKTIRKARKRLICGYDADINVKCPSCEDPTTLNIFMHRDFLLLAG